MKALLVAVALLWTAFGPKAQAEPVTLCTIVADADSGLRLIDEGDCDLRVTPASTFKIAISLMGFDAGFLVDATTPELPFQEGYADWLPAWRQATTPERWIRESVVWYSQQITQALGMDRFEAYVAAFDYGNRDLSAHPGNGNGLTGSWLSASLQISPNEQIAFLRRLVDREFALSDQAYAATSALFMLDTQPDGWRIHGKTGSGVPRRPDGTLNDEARLGWFVGWAERDGRRILFARLTHSAERLSAPIGYVTRDALLADLFASPGIMN